MTVKMSYWWEIVFCFCVLFALFDIIFSHALLGQVAYKHVFNLFHWWRLLLFFTSSFVTNFYDNFCIKDDFKCIRKIDFSHFTSNVRKAVGGSKTIWAVVMIWHIWNIYDDVGMIRDYNLKYLLASIDIIIWYIKSSLLSKN